MADQDFASGVAPHILASANRLLADLEAAKSGGYYDSGWYSYMHKHDIEVVAEYVANLIGSGTVRERDTGAGESSPSPQQPTAGLRNLEVEIEFAPECIVKITKDCFSLYDCEMQVVSMSIGEAAEKVDLIHQVLDYVHKGRT